jgi:hypothetical protein
MSALALRFKLDELIMKHIFLHLLFVTFFLSLSPLFCPPKGAVQLFLPLVKSTVFFQKALRIQVPLLPPYSARPLLPLRRILVTSSMPQISSYGLPVKIGLNQRDLRTFMLTSLTKNIPALGFILNSKAGLISSECNRMKVEILLLNEIKSLVAQNDNSFLYRIFIGDEIDIKHLQDELARHNTSIARDFFIHKNSEGATILSRGDFARQYMFISQAFENIAQQLKDDITREPYVLDA